MTPLPPEQPLFFFLEERSFAKSSILGAPVAIVSLSLLVVVVEEPSDLLFSFDGRIALLVSGHAALSLRLLHSFFREEPRFDLALPYFSSAPRVGDSLEVLLPGRQSVSSSASILCPTTGLLAQLLRPPEYTSGFLAVLFWWSFLPPLLMAYEPAFSRSSACSSGFDLFSSPAYRYDIKRRDTSRPTILPLFGRSSASLLFLLDVLLSPPMKSVESILFTNFSSLLLTRARKSSFSPKRTLLSPYREPRLLESGSGDFLSLLQIPLRELLCGLIIFFSIASFSFFFALPRLPLPPGLARVA